METKAEEGFSNLNALAFSRATALHKCSCIRLPNIFVLEVPPLSFSAGKSTFPVKDYNQIYITC